MMKRLTKFLLFLSILLVLPISASAQSNEPGAFCGNQENKQAKIRQTFGQRNKSYKDALNNQDVNSQARRDRLDSSLNYVRTESDQKRQQVYRLLEEKQSSEQAKELVVEFEQEVEAVVRVRRAKFDEARQQFRKDVDDLLVSRDKQVQKAVNNFQAESESAMQIAKEACAGDRSTSARQNLSKSLAKAKSEFSDKLRARKDFRQQVKQAAEARNQTFKEAIAEFQTSMQLIKLKYSSLR